MDSIILAGGLGKRLGKLTEHTPKPLLEVGGSPILSQILIKLKKFYSSQKNRKCYLTINPKHESNFQEYLRNFNPSMNLELVVEDESIYDSYHGPIKGFYEIYKRTPNNEGILIIAGDCISSLDISKMVSAFRKDPSKSIVALYDINDIEKAESYGCAEIDSRGRIIRFEEKSSPAISTLINSTTYILTQKDMEKVGKYLKQGTRDSLFKWLINNGSDIRGFPFTGFWFDIGTPQSLKEADNFLRKINY